MCLNTTVTSFKHQRDEKQKNSVNSCYLAQKGTKQHRPFKVSHWSFVKPPFSCDFNTLC